MYYQCVIVIFRTRYTVFGPQLYHSGTFEKSHLQETFDFLQGVLCIKCVLIMCLSLSRYATFWAPLFIFSFLVRELI